MKGIWRERTETTGGDAVAARGVTGLIASTEAIGKISPAWCSLASGKSHRGGYLQAKAQG